MANARTADAVITIEGEEIKWLLHPSAGNESCCIFRVPQCLAELQPKTYRPHIVSIGPYHYGESHLEMMQQHKQRYLRDLLARTESTGPKLDDYLQAVASREQDIRDCYSEHIEFDSGHLVDMMVLDGLFIIELFCKECGLVSLPRSHGDDPIFNLAWVKPNLIRDFLRLENQIPFFILQLLYDKSKASRKDTEPSFEMVAFTFISRAVEGVVNQQFKDPPKHLLDLVRLSFLPLDDPPQIVRKHIGIPPLFVQLIKSAKTYLKVIKSNTKEGVRKLQAGLKLEKKKADTYASPVQLIKSARKLYQSGIKFKKVAATSLLDVRFRKGVLEIPNVLLDDLRVDLFLNFVAFEQHRYWHCTSWPITSYAVFMSCLIRTPEDATYLRDLDIIENYLGTDDAVADFFKSLGKDMTFDIDDCHLSKLFRDVNKYQRNLWHVRWAGFKLTYFDTPWSFLSALAALIILVLTSLQTFYAVYAYYNPK